MKLNNVTVSDGSLAELKFPVWCLENNIECFLPSVEGSPYDYVIRGKNGKFYTVQVKQCYHRYKNSYEAKFVASGGNRKGKRKYKKGDFDFIAVYRPKINDWHIIPFDKIKNLKSASFHADSSKNKWIKYRWT